MQEHVDWQRQQLLVDGLLIECCCYDQDQGFDGGDDGMQDLGIIEQGVDGVGYQCVDGEELEVELGIFEYQLYDGV